MDIQARIEELTKHQQVLQKRYQDDTMNIQRLAGAIAILNEQLSEDTSPVPSPNGKVKEKIEA